MEKRVVRIAVPAFSCVVALAVAFWADVTSAQVLYKNNTANVLTSTASWWTTESGSTNPASITTTGTLWFGGSGQAATGTWALGGNLSVGALRLDNLTGTPNYSATISAGDTLTLNNASGILLNSGAGGALTIACDVVAAAAQSWVTSRTLTMSGAVNTGTNQITINTAGGSALMTISGAISGTRSGANVFLLQPTAASGGVLRLTNANNSFVGNIELGTSLRSTLEFTSAGALGASGTANQIRFRNTGGTAGAGSLLLYTGSTNETVTKTIQCDTSIGIRLESNSVGGLVKFNGAFSITSARPLYLGGTGIGDNELAIAFGGATITKRDAGTWVLSAPNSSYVGATTLVGGTLKVSKLANNAVVSSIGSGSTAASLVFNGGALSYIGAGDATNRPFTVSAAPSISANGAGGLTWNAASPTFTTVDTPYVFTLGGTSTAGNSWGTVLGDNGTGAVGLTKAGAGKWIVTGAHTFSGATAVDAGTLFVNGSLANTSGMSVGAGGTLGGSGSIAATLAGAGLVSPGNSPGITTANAVDPTGGMSFAFEFTGTGSPTYGNSSASVNDVLRLTAGSPFTASLSGANVVDVYFDVTSIAQNDTFRGGFYVDAGGVFIGSVGNATYQYWVKGNGTGTDQTFNGQGYFSLANFDAALTITKSTVADTANFGSGTVNGSVTQFVVVPEPATLGLMALGSVMGGFSLWKRRRIAGIVNRE
jgi:fibronectin-binding autotransporter adhesin